MINRLSLNVREILGLFSDTKRQRTDKGEISMEWSFITKANDKMSGRRNRTVFFVFSMISGII